MYKSYEKLVINSFVDSKNISNWLYVQRAVFVVSHEQTVLQKQSYYCGYWCGETLPIFLEFPGRISVGLLLIYIYIYIYIYMNMRRRHKSCNIIIIININDWTLWSVPSPELQLLAPTVLRSSHCSPSLWSVVVWFQRDSVLWHSLHS